MLYCRKRFLDWWKTKFCKLFAKDVYINRQRNLGAWRQLNTVLVSTINRCQLNIYECWFDNLASTLWEIKDGVPREKFARASGNTRRMWDATNLWLPYSFFTSTWEVLGIRWDFYFVLLKKKGETIKQPHTYFFGGKLAAIGIHLGLCVWNCRGIIIENCLAYEITIRPNNIIFLFELCLVTQIPGIVVGENFYVVVGRWKMYLCVNSFPQQQGYLTFDHRPQASTSCAW